MSIEQKILEALTALDQDANAFLGGDIEQTISARAYAIELAGVDSFWRLVIDRLFYTGHCQAAWEKWMQSRP
jgi:hypothetical protein